MHKALGYFQSVHRIKFDSHKMIVFSVEKLAVVIFYLSGVLIHLVTTEIRFLRIYSIKYY